MRGFGVGTRWRTSWPNDEHGRLRVFCGEAKNARLVEVKFSWDSATVLRLSQNVSSAA
jgi:hypothetical protein